MSYERAVVSITIPAAATSGTAQIPLKSSFAQVLGMRAVITSGTDNATGLQLAGNDGKIIYKDAADTKDYTTAIDRNFASDDTQTALTGLTKPFDVTGISGTAGTGNTNIGGGGIVMADSPLTATWSTATAGETILLWVYYKTHIERVRIAGTFPNPAATLTFQVYPPQKFAKLLGFRLTNITDAGMTVKIQDADSRVLFLDSADTDYHNATLGSGPAKLLVSDAETTGLSVLQQDLTGAAMSAAETGPVGTAVGRAPFTVTITNNATNGDPFQFDAYFERPGG